MTRPGFTGYSPLRMWTSVPQIVVVVIRMTASPGPAVGRATSVTAMSPGARKTVARIVSVLGGRLAPKVLVSVMSVPYRLVGSYPEPLHDRPGQAGGEGPEGPLARATCHRASRTALG